MPDNPTRKDPNALRIDHEKKLIWVPGRDQPDELIAPIQQRVDADGVPYQHLVTAQELLEAEEQHKRCMAFVRDAMKARWRCPECGQERPGTQLKPSPAMFDLLREMMQPGGHRVDWNSIVEHLAEHLFCPNAKCKQVPCVPVPREVKS